ncbi:MAG: hypothetical protein LBR23_04200 [Spirochaetaceae bacterium]|jgi:hypothetical protein|nr:hypothetical protein [Spirochaetaceae bacterium]
MNRMVAQFQSVVENDTITLPHEWRGKFNAPVVVTIKERRSPAPTEPQAQSLTGQINAVYDKLGKSVPVTEAATLEVWRELTKNDSW